MGVKLVRVAVGDFFKIDDLSEQDLTVDVWSESDVYIFAKGQPILINNQFYSEPSK